jgi:hypothetical protein
MVGLIIFMYIDRCVMPIQIIQAHSQDLAISHGGGGGVIIFFLIKFYVF